MTMKSLLTFSLVLLFSFLGLQAQDLEPVKWTYEVETLGTNEYLLKIDATIEKGWYLYSQHLADGGPIPTSFHFETSDDFDLEEEVSENGPFVEGFDDMFGMDIRKYKELAEFRVKVKSEKSKFKVKGYLEFMTCDDQKCLPPVEEEFVLRLNNQSYI